MAALNIYQCRVIYNRPFSQLAASLSLRPNCPRQEDRILVPVQNLLGMPSRFFVHSNSSSASFLDWEKLRYWHLHVLLFRTCGFLFLHKSYLRIHILECCCETIIVMPKQRLSSLHKIKWENKGEKIFCVLFMYHLNSLDLAGWYFEPILSLQWVEAFALCKGIKKGSNILWGGPMAFLFTI